MSDNEHENDNRVLFGQPLEKMAIKAEVVAWNEKWAVTALYGFYDEDDDEDFNTLYAGKTVFIDGLAGMADAVKDATEPITKWLESLPYESEA